MIGDRSREFVKMRHECLFLFLIALVSLTYAEPIHLKAEVIGESFPVVTDKGRVATRPHGRFYGCADCFGPFKLKSSGSLEPSDQETYEVSNLDDNDSKTCWAVKGGVGSWFSFSWPLPDIDYWPVDSITLVNGYTKSPDRWRQNSRIRDLKITIDGKLYRIVTLTDTAKVQTVEFPSRLNVHAQEIRFTVLSIYPGNYFDDLCVSEVQLEGGH